MPSPHSELWAACSACTFHSSLSVNPVPPLFPTSTGIKSKLQPMQPRHALAPVPLSLAASQVHQPSSPLTHWPPASHPQRLIRPYCAAFVRMSSLLLVGKLQEDGHCIPQHRTSAFHNIWKKAHKYFVNSEIILHIQKLQKQ